MGRLATAGVRPRQYGEIGTFGASSFLGGLDSADVATIFDAGRRIELADGRWLCHEGDEADAVWFVVSGHVKLSKLGESGREIVLELRGPGELVGEMGAIDGGRRSAAISSLGAVEALVVSRGRFLELLRHHPDVARRLMEALVARLRQAADRQLEMGTVDVIGRLCRRLVELAGSHGRVIDDGVMVSPGISQQELADWLGTSRDSVVRALHELRDAKLIESGRSRLLIRDMVAIRSMAAMSGPAPGDVG